MHTCRCHRLHAACGTLAKCHGTVAHSRALTAPFLSGVVSHWPAFANWTDDYLCQLAGDTEVTVALTPNGRADAVTPLPPNSGSCNGTGGSSSGAAAEGRSGGGGGSREGGEDEHSTAQQPQRVFALPHQVKMPLKDFLLLLRSSKQSKLGASGDSAAELAAAQRQAAAAAAAAAAHPGVVPYLQVSVAMYRSDKGVAVCAMCIFADTGMQQDSSRSVQQTSIITLQIPPHAAASDFVSTCPLHHPDPAALQYQNSSLTAEVPQLLGDVDLLLSWATQAFGEWRSDMIVVSIARLHL